MSSCRQHYHRYTTAQAGSAGCYWVNIEKVRGQTGHKRGEHEEFTRSHLDAKWRPLPSTTAPLAKTEGTLWCHLEPILTKMGVHVMSSLTHLSSELRVSWQLKPNLFCKNLVVHDRHHWWTWTFKTCVFWKSQTTMGWNYEFWCSSRFQRLIFDGLNVCVLTDLTF